MTGVVLSREKILDKAIERGLVQPGQFLSDQEIYALNLRTWIFDRRSGIQSIRARRRHGCRQAKYYGSARRHLSG